MYIRIENLTKKIRGTTVLDNISIELQGGNIYGFSGPNGSGKTMLMRAVSGLIVSNSGTVDIDGKIIGKDISFPDSIGLLIEYPAFINGYTGFRNLKMIADIKKRAGDEQIREAMERVGLNPDDKRTFRKYSLGMKQKLGIACAIMEKPDIIILDEPVNALDEAGVARVHEILEESRARGAIIIIACHDKEQLNMLCDEIFRIENGRIAEHEKV